MLLTIALILFVLWALGFFAFHVAGGLIHILLIIAVIVIVLHLVRGRRVVCTAPPSSPMGSPCRSSAGGASLRLRLTDRVGTSFARLRISLWNLSAGGLPLPRSLERRSGCWTKPVCGVPSCCSPF